jgi:hypothetical protein
MILSQISLIFSVELTSPRPAPQLDDLQFGGTELECASAEPQWFPGLQTNFETSPLLVYCYMRRMGEPPWFFFSGPVHATCEPKSRKDTHRGASRFPAVRSSIYRAIPVGSEIFRISEQCLGSADLPTARENDGAGFARGTGAGRGCSGCR